MEDLSFFLILFFIIIFQRLVELIIARKNEKWMKQQGAIEFGKKHYLYMVLIHSLFFCSFFTEKVMFNRGLSLLWPLLWILFFVTQGIRVWIILSLGKYWNTKIIVLPNAKVIRRGPYRFIKHPNYAVVTLELFIIPLLFNAYFTALLFTILNIVILSIRIPEEERALKGLTEYEGSFKSCNRFFPKLLN
ncbi:isoprenylcysteine carboxylmethyltransferase family protein [Neobacillus sp. PS3-40]|jgi:methyltransferase|uniref:isoprenylcysteine carboxyl methyltransferase family protein n=1 Tax=Neobacillus sp. PS3-40 TaxID=3070679 RepID=UPI0027DF6F35|nr:isoprenylcysteine carboxylmethyltransferase family protein [Neobacillus sp. PS3-40]WML45043.1 isoprenylcysteine carboxylmethyltransferase family protein [Neobacillus sp. PS3-40]